MPIPDRALPHHPALRCEDCGEAFIPDDSRETRCRECGARHGEWFTCSGRETGYTAPHLVARSPSGELIIGTAETIPGTALITHWTWNPESEQYEAAYTGETVPHWDGQETRTAPDGSPVVCDERGGCWPLSACRVTRATRAELRAAGIPAAAVAAVVPPTPTEG